MTYRPYTGVGSRETPADVLDLMRRVALHLYTDEWTLRSGAAPGADSAFEQGATPFEDYTRTEIFLPWEGFELRQPHMVALERPKAEAYRIAARYHPAWATLKEGAKSLHARNVHQVLGADPGAPQPSKFVICWTENGQGGGGTGQALRIARAYRVPIFDLALDEARTRVERFLD